MCNYSFNETWKISSVPAARVTSLLRSMFMDEPENMKGIPDYLNFVALYVIAYPSFLDKVRGQDLGLLDPSTQVWPDTINSEDSPVTLPTKEKLVE